MIDATAVSALVAGQQRDPFAVLGVHQKESEASSLVVWLPGARAVAVVIAGSSAAIALDQIHADGLFGVAIPKGLQVKDYRLQVSWSNGEQLLDDPYRFGALIDSTDLQAFSSGTHDRPYQFLGAHCISVEQVDGVRFAVWAPNASTVSVVGDFNAWEARRHPMRLRLEAGVWEIFIPGIGAHERYKFAMLDASGRTLPWHADPYARQAELRPATASIVSALAVRGPACARERTVSNDRHAPISIYELHPGSWRRVPEDGNRFLNWDELAAQLIPYVGEMGFTHLELMPISEHPFDGSWGYQPTGMYAPTARFGDPTGLRRFIAACHDAGLGVILDWVPGHFPSDLHAQARFDGTHLFEHADPFEGYHPDWNTLIYNFGRNEVRNFLTGNARYWVEEFDIDGLRVDAVASMLYRDYSREPGQWVPNSDGGRENYEAVALLRHVNESLGRTHPQVATIAEESTSWPGVSQPTSGGGLGFHYKWNMGWMNDTLVFMARDPAHRHYHLNELTFGLLYAFSENFVLPLSHDEVVHGKGSLIDRMPGDRWQQFANLRLYFAFMFAHPGKKLLFMGGEFAQSREWNHDRSLDWHLLDQPEHAGIKTLYRELNHFYRNSPALFLHDCEAQGFEWVVDDDQANTVLAFVRRGDTAAQTILVVFNFTPVLRHAYRIGVPHGGHWRECFNSDASLYGGSDAGNLGGCTSEPLPMHGQAQSLSLTLPPLSAVFLGSPE